MWAIMKEFKVLPNDPLLQTLTTEQRDFVILSMNEDILAEQRAQRGNISDGDYNDKDADFYDTTGDWDIMRNGQDAEDIYRQVIEKTGNADYEEKLEMKIHNARTTLVDQKHRELSEVQDYQAKKIQEAVKRAKELEEKGEIIDTDSKVIDYDEWDENLI